MSTAVMNGGARRASVAPRARLRTIRVEVIRSGVRSTALEVAAGTTPGDIAERLGIPTAGMSFRSGPDAVGTTTPLEVDTELLVAEDITAG